MTCTPVESGFSFVYISLKLQLQQCSYRHGNEHSDNTADPASGKERYYDQHRVDFHVAAEHSRIDYVAVDKHHSRKDNAADDQMGHGAFRQTDDYK